MFITEFIVDLGDLGSHDALVLGSVREEGEQVFAEIKKVNVDVPGVGLLDVTKALQPGAIKEIKEKLASKYTAARDRAELVPEDWQRSV